VSRPDTGDGIAARMRRSLERAFDVAESVPDFDALHENIVRACEALVMGGAETCRLVALTVISAVASDPQIRPDIIQVTAGGVDFRSLFKDGVRPVLVAAAQKRSAPWQPSQDPFVSNPFREPSIDAAWVQRRKTRLAGADALLAIVGYVRNEPASAERVLNHLARFELALLEKSVVIYRIPLRLSTRVVFRLLTEWLANDSGGRRHEGLSIALLRFAGSHLQSGWNSIESHHVNDPTPYDALCKTNDIVQAVGEVKAQPVSLEHLRQLADQMGAHQARRGYLFTRTAWLPDKDSVEAEAIVGFLRDQDELGRRIDILDVLDAARFWLPLMDQQDNALPDFLRELARELDAHALTADRRSLALLLEKL